MIVLAAACPPTLAGLRDRAMIFLGFAGAFRRTELAALTVEDLEAVPEGLRMTMRRSSRTRNLPGTLADDDANDVLDNQESCDVSRASSRAGDRGRTGDVQLGNPSEDPEEL